MHTMPTRARSHILKEQSIHRLGDALPTGWVYRAKAPDYGIDGEVEIFGNSVTGNSVTVHFLGWLPRENALRHSSN